jgi:hypothetical protein
MKIGDRVITEDGEGVIVAEEFYSRLNGGMYRFGIQLDVQRFLYPVAFYFQDEISCG